MIKAAATRATADKSEKMTSAEYPEMEVVVCVFTSVEEPKAYTMWSYEPTYATPFETAGEETTLLPVW